jgi:hypothetical protein
MEVFAMVAFIGGNGHEHGDGELCPDCLFRQELTEHLEWAAGDSELAWHEITGEIAYLMCGALASLTALRAGRFDSDLHDPESAATAAEAITRLAGAIAVLRDVLLEDD